MTRFILNGFLFGILCLLFSCKKFLEIPPAPNLIQTSDVFSSEKTALSAISGVYKDLHGSTSVFTNGALSVFPGLAADDIFASSPTTTTDPFYQNELFAAHATVASSFYNHAYRIIYQTNLILEGLAHSSALADSFKTQVSGEMKVIRALMYFYLGNLFGDVPLITSSDYQANTIKPRTPLTEVFLQVLTDLVEAKTQLKAAYPSIGKARPNKWTATALLARYYLFQKDWANAETQVTEIINSGTYNLATTANIGNIFLKGNAETIWEIANPSDLGNVGEAIIFVPASSTVKPTYALTTYLLASFEVGDKRFQPLTTAWVGKNTVSGTDYYYPYKYKQKTVPSGGTVNEYEIVSRLAEIYLIRAEVRAQQNNISGAQADLNSIRNRVGLSNTTANTQNTVLLAIEKENRTEFFAEWGHRWLDLKRTDKADAIIGTIKFSTWQATDKLWPIPEKELINNPFLIQNPGY